jgi:beta-lactamase class A
MSHVEALDAELAALPGTISVWYGPPGGPAVHARAADATHYAASTMKLPVLVALHRAADEGRLDLAAEIEVRNEFASARAGAPAFACRRDYDNDDAVWDRLGGTAPLGWLARRMVVRSSNLAANLVLEQVGRAATDAVWRLVGATASVVGRGIEDVAAAEAGITNLVTAADLAALLGALHRGRLASPAAGRDMLETLLAQEVTEDLAAGLPSGTRVAHKNGWITGVRHAAGLVLPEDAPPFVVVVCATTPLATNDGADEACQIVARVAAAAWADRHRPQAGGPSARGRGPVRAPRSGPPAAR